MAQPDRSGKAMSSRLLTMKFMQRAANSPSSAPSSPSEPPSKKQRTSTGAPTTPRSDAPTTPRSDAQAVQEALAAEERTRNEALDREAADRGDTKWYLSVKQPPASVESPLRVVSAGYSALDGADKGRRADESDEDQVSAVPAAGRRSFGKFNRSLEKQQNLGEADSGSDSDSEDSSDNDEDDDGDESDDPSGTKAMISQERREAGDRARAERKAKKKAEKAEIGRLAEERRKKQPQVNLNNLSSISGTGGGGAKGSPGGFKDMVCYGCGKKGHPKAECPPASQQRGKKRQST